MQNTLVSDCSGKDIFVSYKNRENKLFNVVEKDASGTEFLMKSIDKCLKKAKAKLDDVDCIGICVGPGSWTGSRVAVATLNGLVSGMSTKPEIFTFDTFETFAYNEERAEGRGRNVFFVLPAYGQNVYVRQVNSVDGVQIEPFMNINNLLELAKANSAVCYALENIFDGVVIVRQDYGSIVDKKVVEKQFVSIDEVEPLYIRPSQAEIQLSERLKNLRK